VVRTAPLRITGIGSTPAYHAEGSEVHVAEAQKAVGSRRFPQPETDAGGADLPRGCSLRVSLHAVPALVSEEFGRARAL
jgi:hypothetical protein